MSIDSVATNIITSNGAHDPMASIVGFQLYSTIAVMKRSYKSQLNTYKDKVGILLNFIQKLDNPMNNELLKEIMQSSPFNVFDATLMKGTEVIDVNITNALCKIMVLLKQNDGGYSAYVTQIDMQLFDHFSKVLHEHWYLFNAEFKKLNCIYDCFLISTGNTCDSVATIYNYLSTHNKSALTLNLEEFEDCFLQRPNVFYTDPDSGVEMNVLSKIEKLLVHKSCKKNRKSLGAIDVNVIVDGEDISSVPAVGGPVLSPIGVDCVSNYSDRGFALMNAGYM